MVVRKFNLKRCRCESAVSSCVYCRDYIASRLSCEDLDSKHADERQLDMFVHGGVYETSSSCSSSQDEKEV